jgi:hypothetical protein
MIIHEQTESERDSERKLERKRKREGKKKKYIKMFDWCFCTLDTNKQANKYKQSSTRACNEEGKRTKEKEKSKCTKK